MPTVIDTATAVGYFRVSSPGQAGERHVSLEVQQASFQNYCRTNHLDPTATFTDVASGRKDDRREYRKMLEHVAQEGIGNVVVLFLDRFGRNPREILRRYWELQEGGATVQSVNEDLREELLLLVRAGIAGQESKRTSERVRLALREAASRGKLVSKLPFGYVKVHDRDGVHVEQVPEEAAAVRLAYELATVQNMGYKAMADELNRQGYRTKLGAFFAAQSLKLILLNPAWPVTRCSRVILESLSSTKALTQPSSVPKNGQPCNSGLPSGGRASTAATWITAFICYLGYSAAAIAALLCRVRTRGNINTTLAPVGRWPGSYAPRAGITVGRRWKRPYWSI